MNQESIFRALLYCYPTTFREEYGREMMLVFRDELSDAKDRRATGNLWFRTLRDVITVAPKEHANMFIQDFRYAIRNLAASPGFATVAILSIALGIGATTAIFSLWNGILLSQLEVQEPGQLVMLSDPDASGVQIGGSTGERLLHRGRDPRGCECDVRQVLAHR